MSCYVMQGLSLMFCSLYFTLYALLNVETEEDNIQKLP
jgi:hypothetical protein